jgi:hypothetical protein
MFRPITLLTFLVMGCDPCPDYCEAECLCPQFADDAGCVETCLSTLEAWGGSARTDHCAAALDELESNPDACN